MRYSYTILFIAGIIALWFFSVYRFIDNHIYRYSQQKTHTYEHIKKMHVCSQEKEALSAVCNVLQATHSVLPAQEIQKKQLDDVLHILECMHAHQINVIAYTVDPYQKTKVGVTYLIHITLSGTLLHVAACFSALTSLSFSCINCTATHQDAADTYTIHLDLKCALLCDSERPSNLEQAEGLGG